MMPIDYTLKALETIADHKGLKLEDVEGYTELCQFLTDLVFDGVSDLEFTRKDCLAILKDLVKYVCPSWSLYPMEFHQACQPVTKEVYDD